MTIHADMAGDAHVIVVKIRWPPGHRGVAVLAVIAGWQMGRRFAGGLNAIVTLETTSGHTRVVKHTDLPINCAVTLGAVIGGADVIEGLA